MSHERKARNKPSPLTLRRRGSGDSSSSDSELENASSDRHQLLLSLLKQQGGIVKSPSSTSSTVVSTATTTTDSNATTPNRGGRRGSGNLAYLASRRNSLSPKLLQSHKDANKWKDVEFGSGNQQGPSRQQQRRRQSTSGNFLELPVPTYHHHRSAGSTSPQQQRRRVGSLPVARYTGSGNGTPKKPYYHQMSEKLKATETFETEEDESSDDDNSLNQQALMYRLRTFNIKDNRVVNTGDEYVSRRRSPITVASSSPSHSRHHSPSRSAHQSPRHTPTSHSPTTLTPTHSNTPSCCTSAALSMESIYSNISNDESCYFFSDEENKNRFRVVMLGHAGVGKTALVTQFMTSEYINTYDASLDDEFGERHISVLLDGEESELIFIDHPSQEMSAENSLSTYSPHSCIIVYSIIDRQSFHAAEEILRYIWQVESHSNRAIILVGNKCDLERAREVAFEEGKSLATTYSAKFIETSPGLQHNVDELLVGTLKQCRLRKTFDRKNKKKKKSRRHGNNNAVFSIQELARELMRKLLMQKKNYGGENCDLYGNYGYYKKSKSCQNLHVL